MSYRIPGTIIYAYLIPGSTSYPVRRISRLIFSKAGGDGAKRLPGTWYNVAMRQREDLDYIFPQWNVLAPRWCVRVCSAPVLGKTVSEKKYPRGRVEF